MGRKKPPRKQKQAPARSGGKKEKIVSSNIANIGKEILRLRAANRRLLSQLERERSKKADIQSALSTAIRDCIASITIPKCIHTKKNTTGGAKGSRRQDSECAIFVLSDWQLGKVTPTYSSKICEERIITYTQKALRIVDIHRKMKKVDIAKIYLLGDIVEGELIFPGQAHEIDSSLFVQSATNAPKILSWVINQIANEFDLIEVHCIHGNHGSLGGRLRKEYMRDSNADNIAYQVTKAITSKLPNVNWVWPSNVKSWYAIDYIGKFGFILFHGDQMRGGGFGGIPFYGFARAIHSWSSGAIPEEFHYAICGHWHQGASLMFNFKTLWINGSVESYNVYAQEQLKSMSAPHQWLLFCHPEKGVTAEYRIWLSENPYGFRGNKKTRM